MEIVFGILCLHNFFQQWKQWLGNIQIGFAFFFSNLAIVALCCISEGIPFKPCACPFIYDIDSLLTRLGVLALKPCAFLLFMISVWSLSHSSGLTVFFHFPFSISDSAIQTVRGRLTECGYPWATAFSSKTLVGWCGRLCKFILILKRYFCIYLNQLCILFCFFTSLLECWFFIIIFFLF